MPPARPSARRPLAVAVGLALVLLAACQGGDDDPATAAPPAAPTDGGTATTADDGAGDDGAADDGAGGGGGLAAVPGVVREVEPSVVAVVRPQGNGSGVIYAAEGVVITNAHVVRDAPSLEVVFADGERAPATVVATDTFTDLAVLRVERTGLPAAEFADELPDVGTLAVAIGAPLGFEGTVTAGIVSGLQRSIPAAAAQGQEALVDLIQTDAAISPGNSGGALVDVDGRIVGVNIAYIPPSTGAVSLGFAIPAPTVTRVVDELLEDGRAAHPFIGITYAQVTAQVAERFDLPADRGILVTAVAAGGPAGEAGIGPGDVVVAFGGEEVATAGDLLSALRGFQPGDEVDIALAGPEGEVQVTVTLGQRPTG